MGVRTLPKAQKQISRPPMVVLPLIIFNFNGRGGKRRKEVGSFFIGLRKRTLKDLPVLVERSRGREVERGMDGARKVAH